MKFTSNKISKIPYVLLFLNQVNKYNIIIGWGRKKGFFKAQVYAEKHGLNVLCLEDGFIRSLGLGKEGCNPLSLVVDATGIYFDALQTSDLEQLILLNENEQLNIRAKANIKIIQDYAITKYNQRFKEIPLHVFKDNIENVLVIDQTLGDQSIQYAGANVNTFKNMLQQAIQHHPHATIWVKIHPDVLAGKSKGHFSAEDLNYPQIKILSENYNPIELLSFIQHVYVVSSQLGFEALLCGKKVHCFGVPWYAGWGITDDTYAPLHILNYRRQVKRSLLHLFACAYLKYARYVSPITQKPCELEEILELLIPNIQFQKKLPDLVTAYGFNPWKKQFIREFLGFPKTEVKFQNICKPNKASTVLAWGKKVRTLKQQGYAHVITVEDGFIRSVGLGASLIRPCSLVFDDIGIYYDATQPSRIEHLLQKTTLNVEQYNRVRKLCDLLVKLNISKYNVGEFKKLTRPVSNKKVLLVIGQVEDDMSVQLGSMGIKTNLELLKEVRKNNKNAHIIYKPHPDVHAGLRIGKIIDRVVLQFANQIELDASILECFEICDEVHTITSLSGFEALLRNIKVFCYGMPFYAGWGLTVDKYSCPRRCRRIDLETLVHVTLIDYAVYNIPLTKNMNIPMISPEDVILYIQQQLNSVDKNFSKSWKDVFVKFKNLINR